MKRKLTLEDFIFDTIKIFFLLFILIITVYPFLNTLAYSFNDGIDSIKTGITIFPRKFTLENYRAIFNDTILVKAFINSVSRTVIAVFSHLLGNAVMGFVLAKKNFVFKKLFTTLYIIPMYFVGGLIPTYILMKTAGLVNNFNVYWIPGITTFYYILLMRTYIKGIPESISESAYLDGASDFLVFTKMILPLSIPLLATLALFIGVEQWNAWMDTLIYNSNDPNLTTLQYELMRKISSINALNNANTNAFEQSALAKTVTITPKVLRAAMTMVVTVPIVFLYPFLQRYFVHGLTVGGIKE